MIYTKGIAPEFGVGVVTKFNSYVILIGSLKQWFRMRITDTHSKASASH